MSRQRKLAWPVWYFPIARHRGPAKPPKQRDGGLLDESVCAAEFADDSKLLSMHCHAAPRCGWKAWRHRIPAAVLGKQKNAENSLTANKRQCTPIKSAASSRPFVSIRGGYV
jgi:hypothetical protein